MTAPDVDRVDPPRIADERASLDAWLEYYRASFLHKCAGLDGRQLAAETALDDLETFTVHCARSREVLDKLGLDDGFGTERPFTVRWSYQYLMKEYARHLGHADLLRERIDGVIGE